MKRFGEQFLHQKDSSLHTSEPVEKTSKRLKARGEKVSQKPAEKIGAYLDRLESILNPESLEGHGDFDRKERNINLLKERLYENVIIKPEDIPESYFENQKRLARERGEGDVEITSEIREQHTEVIISDQESTLDSWIDYLTSDDSDSYPVWSKYWAFAGMLKLSSYNKEKQAFGKRSKDTIAPFPDLDREALAYTVDAIIKKANQEKVPNTEDNVEFQKLLQGANFGKLYAHAIEKVTPAEENELLTTAGEWIKYDQGSDHMLLVDSLQGHGTGWCTAGESTAESQLKNGDFHVYYSYDEEGKPTIPRVAIRMDESNIAEVRGIASDQNLDPSIVNTDILDDKLGEFSDGEGEKYQKKSEDMKQLTEISHRQETGEELTKDDFRFLYEIDSKIQGFGYQKDPRIKEMLATRDIKSDLSSVIGCSREEISTTEEEALSGGIKYHVGDLYLHNLTSVEGLATLPESIGGSLDLSGLTSAEGLTLPDRIGGSLFLSGLTSAEGLTLPESIGGNLYFDSLTSAEGLTFSDRIGDSLNLSGLTSVEGLTLPDSIGGDLDFYSLISVEGLAFPDSIGGDLNLHSLTSVEGLVFPDSIGGNLILNDLTFAEGLTLPDRIDGSLDLNGLTSAEGLTLPGSIGGDLNLNGLTSTEGLILPDGIGGNLWFNGLTSAEGLTLPDSIGGGLYLNGLTSAEDLTLPDSIGGGLYLNGLTSAEGLILPDGIGGSLNLNGLTSAEGLTLSGSIGGSLWLDGLTSAEGLIFPDSIGSRLDLHNLTSAEGLTLPDSIGGDLDLNGLTSAEGLTLPGSIGRNLYLGRLTSAEGLTLPESVGGYLDLSGLPQKEINQLRIKYPELNI